MTWTTYKQTNKQTNRGSEFTRATNSVTSNAMSASPECRNLCEGQRQIGAVELSLPASVPLLLLPGEDEGSRHTPPSCKIKLVDRGHIKSCTVVFIQHFLWRFLVHAVLCYEVRKGIKFPLKTLVRRRRRTDLVSFRVS